MHRPTYDVFLSHNSADKRAVEEIARRLRDKAHLEPFLDKWHLIPGEPWQEELERALDASHACAVFLGPGGLGTWENEEMRAALAIRAGDPSFRVIPTLLPGTNLPERGRLPHFLARLTWVDFRAGLDDEAALHTLVCGIQGIAPGPAEQVGVSTCPFRGLSVFEEEHAAFFFGREALCQQLVEHLRQDRFLAVVGPSGSGKSSVVRAGLVPLLRHGALDGSAAWPIIICKPGQAPLRALAARLLPLLGPVADPLAAQSQLVAAMAQSERGLHTSVQVALGALHDTLQLVLVVDQFEELFALCDDEGARRAFIANLLYAAGLLGGQIRVVITLRADFLGRCAAYADLGARLKGMELVGPLDSDELRRVIISPAEHVGLHYEKDLVATILNDLGDEPGFLPLLQYTLLELWQQRRGGWLTSDAYRAAGGVRGTLASRAETVYSRLNAEQQEAARRILLRLTQPGEGTEDTRRRASWQELYPAGANPQDVERVVDALAAARLLVVRAASPGSSSVAGQVEAGTSSAAPSAERQAQSANSSAAVRRTGSVEVAHEALIRAWPRLRVWVETDREGLRFRQRLAEQAQEWERREGDESELYRGPRLAAAVRLLEESELSDLERRFVLAGAEAQRAQRRALVQRRRLRMATLALTVVLLLIGAGFAVVGIERARRATSPWQPIATLPYNDPVIALAVGRRPTLTYYVATANIGLWQSDNLVDWTITRGGLPTGNPEGGVSLRSVRAIRRLAIDLSDSWHLIAAIADHRLYDISRGGRAWTEYPAPAPAGQEVADLALYGDLALAVTRDGHLYAGGRRSDWRQVDDPAMGSVYVVKVLPDGRTVFAGTSVGLFRAVRGVWQWTPALTAQHEIEQIGVAADGRTLILALVDQHDRGTIVRLLPGGQTEALLEDIPDQVVSITAAPGTLYVLLKDGQVYRLSEGAAPLKLYHEPGAAYQLLAVPTATGDGTRLLLGHVRGLLEYHDSVGGAP